MAITDYPDVDTYISIFPKDVQKILRSIRKIIKAEAPDAMESISYGMPAYKLNGPLVYFAAFRNHIGFYGTPTAGAAFASELSEFKMGKGSIQFPLTEPIPFDLIQRMVKFRVEQNLQKVQKTVKK